ncbi:hypothetical protein SMH99_18020 [Spiroplasma poulsonii]|nr:hypothetical protein [Spiroplasma poulsonii]PWF99230.1 hypothetical protein SMH99_18020 [Spiroplasma poulsonii]
MATVWVRIRKELNKMNETLMIALLVLAGAGGMGSLGILGLSAKKLKI